MDKNTTSSNINENKILKNINTSPTLHLPSYINICKAHVGKRIPKNRFNFELNSVESIQWLYKISYDTVGIKDSDEFKEYQIFEVEFKEKIAKDILIKIQSAIPYPILFRIQCSNKITFSFVYGKLYLNYDSNLLTDSELNISATSIKSLVIGTIERMTNIVAREDEQVEFFAARVQEITKLSKEIEQLTRQRDNEKQPKKKIELNEQIREIQKQLEEKR